MDRLPPHLRIGLALLFLTAIGFGALSYLTSRRGANVLEPVLQVPSFTLTDQRGASFSSSQLAGRVWIADLIFTRCAGPCPLMSAKMARLQEMLEGEPDVRFVSVSVDPVADTPAMMSAYAQKFKADPARWVFLTGDVKTIYGLAEQGFKLPVGPPPPPGTVQAGDLITHSTRFLLVDRNGFIRGFFDSEAPDFQAQIVDAARVIL